MDSLSHPILSAEYRELNAELHRREASYGTTGRRYVDVIRRLAREHGARQILDYGCGKQDLSKALSSEFDVRDYDPAISGLDAPPKPADLVACIDVLEHVEPDYLDSVLTNLVRVTIKVAFFTIATCPSGKRLADGTNPHRIVESADWWVGRIRKDFQILKVEVPNGGNGVQVLAARPGITPSSSRTRP